MIIGCRPRQNSKNRDAATILVGVASTTHILVPTTFFFGRGTDLRRRGRAIGASFPALIGTAHPKRSTPVAFFALATAMRLIAAFTSIAWSRTTSQWR